MKMQKEYRDKYYRLLIYVKNIRKLKENDVIHLHHILPKFTKPKRNILVKLTPTEHCLAHYYLWKGFAKSKNKKAVEYLLNAYKGLSIAFGSGNGKVKRMRQFQKDIEKEICDSLELADMTFETERKPRNE